MKAWIWKGVNDLELDGHYPDPQAKPGWVVLKVLSAGVCSAFCIALLAAAATVPFAKVPVPFSSVSLPLPAILMTLCGLGIAVMFGSIFNLATEGLGRLVPVASGITMSLVSGGALLAVVGVVTDRFRILSCCWVFAAFLGYILFFAVAGSATERRTEHE